MFLIVQHVHTLTVCVTCLCVHLCVCVYMNNLCALLLSMYTQRSHVQVHWVLVFLWYKFYFIYFTYRPLYEHTRIRHIRYTHRHKLNLLLFSVSLYSTYTYTHVQRQYICKGRFFFIFVLFLFLFSLIFYLRYSFCTCIRTYGSIQEYGTYMKLLIVICTCTIIVQLLPILTGPYVCEHAKCITVFVCDEQERETKTRASKCLALFRRISYCM